MENCGRMIIRRRSPEKHGSRRRRRVGVVTRPASTPARSLSLSPALRPRARVLRAGPDPQKAVNLTVRVALNTVLHRPGRSVGLERAYGRAPQSQRGSARLSALRSPNPLLPLYGASLPHPCLLLSPRFPYSPSNAQHKRPPNARGIDACLDVPRFFFFALLLPCSSSQPLSREKKALCLTTTCSTSPLAEHLALPQS